MLGSYEENMELGHSPWRARRPAVERDMILVLPSIAQQFSVSLEHETLGENVTTRCSIFRRFRRAVATKWPPNLLTARTTSSETITIGPHDGNTAAGWRNGTSFWRRPYSRPVD